MKKYLVRHFNICLVAVSCLLVCAPNVAHAKTPKVIKINEKYIDQYQDNIAQKLIEYLPNSSLTPYVSYENEENHFDFLGFINEMLESRREITLFFHGCFSNQPNPVEAMFAATINRKTSKTDIKLISLSNGPFMSMQLFFDIMNFPTRPIDPSEEGIIFIDCDTPKIKKGRYQTWFVTKNGSTEKKFDLLLQPDGVGGTCFTFFNIN